MMVAEVQAKIFLADQRGLLETDWFRTLSLFNYKNYQNEFRQPFGRLQVFNEHTLAGNHKLELQQDIGYVTVLLPLVGSIIVDRESVPLNAGEIKMIHACKNIIVENPYEGELISFLEIQLSEEEIQSATISFDLMQNNLNLILKSSSFKISIGKFDGRSDGAYNVERENSLFCFSVQGAFEVQDRLLHPRDGLALWNADEVEFEALSNEAILLVIELFP